MFLSIIREQLSLADVSEVPAVGAFKLCDETPKLFPGSVYGFFVELTPEEVKALFEEAQNRSATFISSLENFKPIKDNYYPIYWGKDKSIGKRPYEHIKNPKGTGAIRLSTYKSLHGKTIHSLAIVVDDNDKLENYLQRKYPHLLLTKTEQYIAT